MENGAAGEAGRGGEEDGSGHMAPGSEFSKVHSVIVDGGDRFGVSTITFDLQEELIWMGNQGGHVTSYYGNNMEKYTSFQVHATQEIRQILTFDELILILSQSQLRGQVRRGLPVFTHTSENMRDVQCILQTSPNTILMGGHQEDLIEFDVNTSTQTKTVQLTDSGCAILRSQGRLICTGEPTGQIHLLDSRTFRKEHTLEAHSGSLSDFDVHGNLMVTCGFSARHGNLAVDRFLKVYDIRIMRALAPIPVSVDPFLLRFLPSFSSRIATLSPSGQMEILETQAVSQANICLYQVTNNASMMSLSFDVSSSCHHLAFGDSGGHLHLFSSNPTATFNSFSRNTEFPEPIETYPTLNFNDDLASFATIPFPFSTTPTLLSDWPLEYCTPVYRRIPHIEPSILQSVKTLGTTMTYAPNPGTFRRNQMRYTNSSLSGGGDSGTNTLNNNFFSGKPMSPTPTTSNGNNLNNNNSHSHGGPEVQQGPIPPHKQNGHVLMGVPGPFGPPHAHPQAHGGLNGVHNHNHSPANMKHHHHLNTHPPPPPPHHFPLSPHHHGPGPGHHNHMGPPPPPPFFYQGPPPHGQGPPGPPLGMMSGGPRSYFQKPGPFKNITYYPGKRGSYHGNRYQLPKRYTKYDWKKNFFEESDMESFNRTKFPGLEATQANAYSNSLLQILYHIDYLRVRLISHLCDKEACLSCELGFLFHMMDKTRVIPCIASNFLRAFRLVPEASALGLILQESQSKQRGAFLNLIQSFNRFILHQIETETGKVTEEGSERTDPVSQLFAMKQENVNRCTRCGREEKKESTVLLSNLLYSPDATDGGKRCKFIELLQKSLCPERTTPAWCEKCSKYQSTFQSRVPKALPPFLSLNTCLDDAHDFQLWRNYLESICPEKGLKSDVEMSGSMGSKGPPLHQKCCRYGKNCMRPDCKFWHEGRGPATKMEHGLNVKMTEFELNPETQVKWLPLSLRVVIEERRRVVCVDLDGHDSLGHRELPMDVVRDGSAADYELVAVTCFIRDGDTEEKNNLVSLVHVDPAYFQRSGQPESKSNWFIFNDFCVREVPVVEAYSFNPKWKIPCVVYYRKKNAHMPKEILIPPEIIPTVTIDIFTSPEEGRDGKKRKVTYKPLDPEEIPVKGDLVAMDAEFVTLGQEETELRSDGKLATVKPQQMTVARVTCIRGQGELEGTPFLDDYISTQEVVVDYLTKFSGIQPGDLDVNFSSKNITMLKMVYLKMRFLIDSGVKFVGHGLNNDFRVINLIVPPDQIVDTVALFYLPNQRMISLRFLAWHFLGLVIQSEVHDSTEDARTALQLYRKYEELKSSGQLEKALEELYETGKKAQWKVPSEQLPAVQPPPPVSQ